MVEARVGRLGTVLVVFRCLNNGRSPLRVPDRLRAELLLLRSRHPHTHMIGSSGVHLASATLEA